VKERESVFVCFHALLVEAFSPFNDYTLPGVPVCWLQLSRTPPPPFNVFFSLSRSYLISCDNNSNYLCFAPHSFLLRRLALVVVEKMGKNGKLEYGRLSYKRNVKFSDGASI